ncbi:MAG: thiamine pyrophosphokinase [bacterium P3]|nr:MAG: thiamine pyrophosphokinase [bacterium P3]KWW40023.1 MAG: thiamine pyrophosphokinase [bacterium F083]
MNIVILAAGDFPTRPEPLCALRDADFVVCCDAACKSLLHTGFKIPDYMVVGDGDSLTATDKMLLGDKWVQVDEQDYNDLHKAMTWAISRFGIQDSTFTIIGATGHREDHTLGNISYLATFAEEYPGADIEMLTDYGRLVAMRGERRFASFPRQQVSVFPMAGGASVSSRGLQWPLDGLRLDRWWQATLNNVVADSFELRSDSWLIVFRTYDPKS